MNDIQQWQRPMPLHTKCARIAAWVVALAIFLPWGAIWHRASDPKQTLSDQQVQGVQAFLNEKLAHTKQPANTWTALDMQRDLLEVRSVQYEVDRYLHPLSDKLAKRAEVVGDELYRVKQEQLKVECGLPKEQAGIYADQTIHAANMTVTAGGRDWHAPFLPPPPPRQPLGQWWLGVLYRYLLAWAFSLIPALVGVLLQFRGRSRDLVAELALAPWRPICAVVFWWWGLGSYQGDALKRRFEQLEHRFRFDQNHWPDETERAALWQQANEPVLGFETALQKVREAPELITATPRRFAFSTALCAALAAPIQLACQIGTAVAQTVRAKADTTVVDTTRRRPDQLTVQGILQATMNGEGTKPTLGIVRLRHEEGRVGLAAEVDLLTSKVTEAAVTAHPASGVTVQAGQLWLPTTYDFPPPEKGSLLRSAAGPLVPGFLDRGLMASLTRGPATIQAAAVNGEGTGPNNDSRLELDARAAVKRGPAAVSAAFREGRQPFRMANASLKRGLLTLRAAWAARLDLARSSWNADLVFQPAYGSVGLRVMNDGLVQVMADRTVGGLRINPVVGFGRRTGPIWALRLQHSFTSTVP